MFENWALVEQAPAQVLNGGELGQRLEFVTQRLYEDEQASN